MWNEVPKSAPLARPLNQAHVQTVPWAVENTPMLSSQPVDEAHDHDAMNHGEHEGMVMAIHRIALQQVVETANERGVKPGYSITPPVGDTGVYTIGLFADDPRNDTTPHIDQYSIGLPLGSPLCFLATDFHSCSTSKRIFLAFSK